MDEKVFYEKGSIRVTSARFVAGNQTYAMSAVNSVKVASANVTPSNTISGILVAVGAIWLLCLLLNSSAIKSYFFPSIILAIGVFWFRSIKETFEYRIVLTTSSGEESAFQSNNEQDILPIEKALHEAIIFRG